MVRSDGRKKDELRSVRIERRFLKFAEGSCLIGSGGTRVICTATVEERVPPFLKGKGKGWVTAEYSMLPMATPKRVEREAKRGRLSGRTHEIQRLIGRSLRAVVDLTKLGERTIVIDCDVIQADGGTRVTSITGAFVALTDTVNRLIDCGVIENNPIIDSIAATSVGIVDGELLLDLTYEEDSMADVDMNVVMTGKGGIVEVQGTAEQNPFSKTMFDGLYDLAEKGIGELKLIQFESLKKMSSLEF